MSLFLFAGILVSCKKLIEVNAPNTSTNAETVYKDNATAAAVLTGIYTKMSNQTTSFGNGDFSVLPGLSADELTLYDLNNSDFLPYYRNALNSAAGFNLWDQLYPIIFVTNSAIEGLEKSSTLTPAVKQHLLGEAKFIRAFCYFYLVNLYGDVPLAVSTDFKVNASLDRSSKEVVYQQIIKDLKEARHLLSEDYLNSDALSATPERVRPNKWAATSLLARAYLYTGDYVNAEIESTAVINNISLYSLNSLNDVFLKNSTEAIWQLQPVGVNEYSNTGEGRLFVLPSSGFDFRYPVYLSNSIANAFEPGDNRKVNWTGNISAGSVIYFYPYKYKVGREGTTTIEYSMVFRLGEQYLIRAEARVQQGNTTGAADDLNIILNRAGLSNTPAATKTDLLSAILQERKVELFTEWGHRWLDLKRTNNTDAVMSTIAALKGASWDPYKALYPIPNTDIIKNQSLVQNPGYN